MPRPTRRKATPTADAATAAGKDVSVSKATPKVSPRGDSVTSRTTPPEKQTKAKPATVSGQVAKEEREDGSQLTINGLSSPLAAATDESARWPFSPVCCSPDAFSLMCQQVQLEADGKRLLDTDAGLLAAACAVALHARPDLEPTECDDLIEELADAVRRRHGETFGGACDADSLAERTKFAPQAAMAYLHEALFDGPGAFVGNNGDFYNPNNSFLPTVLERRRGLPITLALVYKLVAGRLGLRCWGVGLPGHFLAGVECGAGPVLVDCFHGGRLLDRQDAAERVAACVGPEADFSDDLLRPVTHRHWITRLIQNLLQTYTGAGRYEDVAAMLELELVLWPDQYHLQRDLGLVLARLGHTRPAATWLGRYLDQHPDDPQRGDLEELMGVLN